MHLCISPPKRHRGWGVDTPTLSCPWWTLISILTASSVCVCVCVGRAGSSAQRKPSGKKGEDAGQAGTQMVKPEAYGVFPESIHYRAMHLLFLCLEHSSL